MRKFFSSPIDWFTLAIPIILTALGIITIYTISFAEHSNRLAIDQGIYTALGLGAMLFFMFSDYRALRGLAWVVYGLGLLLLIPLLPPLADRLPFVLSVFGAARWIDFGIFQLQPAELFKLILAISGSAFLAGKIGQIGWKKVVVFLVLALIPFGFVLSQPDLGTAAVIFVIAVALFFTVQPPWRLIAAVVAVFLIALPILWGQAKPYQKNRLETFLNPELDPQGQGYNVRQSLIAVGSGGLTGRGFGQGSQTVLNFLPVPHADFIFAGYAEATGFFGGSLLLLLYTVLLFRIVAIARESNDEFGRLLAIAIGAKFLFQTVVHIGMNIGLLPVTGIPLPFMSYGGTALIIDLAAIGILESIHIRHTRARFYP